MSEEKWLPVCGWEGLYNVSSLGRIRSLPRRGKNINRVYPGRNIKLSGNRYFIVNLYRDNKKHSYLVHRLVAGAFLGNIPDDKVVDHIDGDKKNNDISNLRFLTTGQNIHKGMSGNSKYIGVHWCKTKSKYIATMKHNHKHKTIGHYDCELEAAFERGKYERSLQNTMSYQ